MRTIVSGSSGGTISIAGLDPEGVITGSVHEDCDFCGPMEFHGAYSGTGVAVRANGGSIRSEVKGNFRFDLMTPGQLFARMSRTHKGPDNVVCVETYWIEGKL